MGSVILFLSLLFTYVLSLLQRAGEIYASGAPYIQSRNTDTSGDSEWQPVVQVLNFLESKEESRQRAV